MIKVVERGTNRFLAECASRPEAEREVERLRKRGVFAYTLGKGRVGRPAVADPRMRMYVSFTLAELTAVTEAAKAAELSISDYVRTVVLAAIAQ